MTAHLASDPVDPYGVMTDATTLRLRRLLPGPIDRVWQHLTDSDLRRRWLAAGEMDLRPGGTVEMVWRNDELTDPPGLRPEGMGTEHRMTGEILAVEPPHLLRYTWPGVGEVTFELAEAGDQVHLTLTHRRIPDAGTRRGVSVGWHSHLDLLAARLSGAVPAPHWDNFRKLRAEYDARSAAQPETQKAD